MISQLISRLMILTFGTLYPAYRSYKAVKTKDVREYVKWMMYWIVFAFFTAVENAADLFISWLPLYYEVKILFLIWLLSPATKGSSILYRKFVHPWLARHEKEIDKYLASAKESSYTTLMRVGKQGINVATDTFLKTAVTGQNTLITTLKKYSSMQDLRASDTDSVDSRQALPARATWHGDQQLRNQDDQMDYNFDDDYRILEQQYHLEDPAGNPLPEDPRMQRTMSMQNTIPETQQESDLEEVEEADQTNLLSDDPDDEDFVPASEKPPKKQAVPTAPPAPNEAQKRRSLPRSSSDAASKPRGRATSSQPRGYSTLPRSRPSKAEVIPEDNYGGTLPRASKRRPKLQARSKEA